MDAELVETLCAAIREMRPHVKTLPTEAPLFIRGGARAYYTRVLDEAALDLETGWKPWFAYTCLHMALEEIENLIGEETGIEILDPVYCN